MLTVIKLLLTDSYHITFHYDADMIYDNNTVEVLMIPPISLWEEGFRSARVCFSHALVHCLLLSKEHELSH